MRILKLVAKVSAIFLMFSVIDCGEKPPLAIWKTSAGKEYPILKIEVIYSSEYGKMLTVGFKSENINNAMIRKKEFQDMYLLVAQNLQLEEFTYIGLEAAPKGNPQFGCQRMTGYRNNKPIEEVKKLVDGTKKRIP